MGWASDALFRDIHNAAIKSGMYSSGVLSVSGGSERSSSRSSYKKESNRTSRHIEDVKEERDLTFLEQTFCLGGLESNPDLELITIKEEKEEINMNYGVEGKTYMFNITATIVFGSNGHEKHLATLNVNFKGLFDINGVNLWLDKNTGEYTISMPSKKTGRDKYFPTFNVLSSEVEYAILDACIAAYSKR